MVDELHDGVRERGVRLLIGCLSELRAVGAKFVGNGLD